MLVKIKNRTAFPVLLKAVSGDTIQINAGVIKEVSDEFLVSYDSKAIQLLSKKPIVTEVAVAEVKAEVAVESPKSSSKKKSTTAGE